MRSDSQSAYKQRDVEKDFDVGMTRDTIRSGVSTSGKERNHLFMNVGGRDFEELSGLSGVDSASDGRAFAWLDIDQDGMLDLATVNANAPLFELFRNQMPKRPSITVELVGGNTEATANPQWTARDAAGAKVIVQTSAGSILRELHIGEGFAAQNSHSLHIGLGEETVEGLSVRWPSGRTTAVDVGSDPGARVLTIFEDPERPTQRRSRETPEQVPVEGAPQKVNAYITVATWCGSCKASYPDLRRLVASFGGDELELFAVPTEDRFDTVAAYWKREQPPLELLDPAVEGPMISRMLTEAGDALPWTVLTDERGRILASFSGVPTISRIRGLLEEP